MCVSLLQGDDDLELLSERNIAMIQQQQAQGQLQLGLIKGLGGDLVGAGQAAAGKRWSLRVNGAPGRSPASEDEAEDEDDDDGDVSAIIDDSELVSK